MLFVIGIPTTFVSTGPSFPSERVNTPIESIHQGLENCAHLYTKTLTIITLEYSSIHGSVYMYVVYTYHLKMNWPHR